MQQPRVSPWVKVVLLLQPVGLPEGVQIFRLLFAIVASGESALEMAVIQDVEGVLTIDSFF